MSLRMLPDEWLMLIGLLLVYLLGLGTGWCLAFVSNLRRQTRATEAAVERRLTEHAAGRNEWNAPRTRRSLEWLTEGPVQDGEDFA